MTRLNERLLVQHVDQLIVIIDEHAGTEIEIPLQSARMLLRALTYLLTDEKSGQ